MYLRHARCHGDDRFLTDETYALERCAACPHFYTGQCEAGLRNDEAWTRVPSVIAGKTRAQRVEERKVAVA